MKSSIVKEYIERTGLVTREDLLRQAGAGYPKMGEAIADQMAAHEIFYCRFAHGKITLMSRHLVFCLLAVCPEPENTANEQELYDWLCENEGSTVADMQGKIKMTAAKFEEALFGLSKKFCVAPSAWLPPEKEGHPEAILDEKAAGQFCWVTDAYWLHDLYKPARYGDIAYCIAELKRLLAPYFTPQEINGLIYRGER